MRILMWFAVGFAAACGLGVFLPGGMWCGIAALICLIFTVCAFFLKHNRAKVAMVILVGMTMGFTWFAGFDGIYLSVPKEYHGQTLNAEVEITDYSRQTEYGTVADGRIQLDGKFYTIRCYRYTDDPLVPGDRISGSIRLQYTLEQDLSYHPGKGIFLLGYCREDVTVTPATQRYFRYFPAYLRHGITAMLDVTFPADTVAFARALLLGDSSLLSYEQNTNFSVSGIRHVIAVSGMHVSILFSLIYVLSLKNRFLTAALGIPALVIFCAVAGFTPSVVRACIMQGLMILSMLLYKEYDPPTALATAVLVMLMINPLAITAVSLQLSAGCMMGIFGFSGKIQQALQSRMKAKTGKKNLWSRLRYFLISSVSVTLSAMTVTIPLCAISFGTVSLIGILTNLLTLWVISFVFYGIMAACIGGAIWLPLGKGIAWLVSWPIRYVLLAAKWMASVPYGCVYTESIYVVLWLVFCYILLSVFLIYQKKRPWILACCMAVGFVAAVFLSWLEPRVDSYRMTVLDVGQGQCILLQTQGKTYMVDCGGDYPQFAADTAAQTLLSQGVRSLDGLILTHYDKDHAEGAELLLSRIPARSIYLPDMEDTGTVRTALEAYTKAQIIYLPPEGVLSLPDGCITLFGAKAGQSDNESSVCILFQPEKCDILITGDRTTSGEDALLEQTQLPDLEVLVVGHHGGQSSTGLPLLAATYPEIAVISVGADNPYGHPSQQVLDRLELFGCQVLRTDLEGTIVIRG